MLAFVLLAVALGLLMGMLSGGLRQVNDAARASEATLHAQSLLDALGALEPIVPGTRRGELDDGRYRWNQEITEFDDPAPVEVDAASASAAPLEGGPKLYRVALEVAWGKGGPRERLRVVTLRARTPQEIGGAR